MVTYKSRFIGDFKLGDNIVFNLDILKCLYKYRTDGNPAQKNYLQKPITLQNISIIEALIYDHHYKIKSLTKEGVNLPQETVDYVRSKQIGKFETLIASAEKQDFFDLKGTVFYEKLTELRMLRNRLHIQNTKKNLEPDDRHAFSEERMVLSEQVLEQVIKTFSTNHERPYDYVRNFDLPWATHFP